MSLHVDVDVGTDDRAFVICIVCVCAWIVLIHIVCRDYACTALAGRARTRDGRRDADGRTYRSPLTSPLTARDAHTTRRVVTPGRTKSGRMQKQRPTPPRYMRDGRATDGQSVHCQRPHSKGKAYILYGAVCGSAISLAYAKGSWPSRQACSCRHRQTSHARAGGPTTSHHRGLSRVGRRKPELADGLSLSPLAVGPTQILMTRRTEAHVERARAAEHEFSPHGGL